MELLDSEVEVARNRILDGDNGACFIERERILAMNLEAAAALSVERRYAFFLGCLAEGLSCPVEDEDALVGRMVEGRGERFVGCPGGLNSVGHVTLDWPLLLSQGLTAVAASVAADTDEERLFAANALDCAAAVSRFAARWAAAAEAKAASVDAPRLQERFCRAAAALRQVPAGPARSFREALQSIWLVHLVTSCVIGARDFAFGRLDQYLLPYYRRDVEAGRLSRDEAVSLLAALFLKSNEITGTATHNYQQKPIPSLASKQYLIIGGSRPDGSGAENELSLLVLEAAERVKLPQPVITIRLASGSGAEFKSRVAKAVVALGSQLNIFNDAVVIPAMLKRGVSAFDYAMVGCCRLNIPGKMDWGSFETFHNVPAWLMETLSGGVDFPSFDALLAAFSARCADKLAASVEANSQSIARRFPGAFHFESLLLSDCVSRRCDYSNGGVRYRPQNHYLGGLATVVDSLAAIRKLVFEERRYALSEFLGIVADNFRAEPKLRLELLNDTPKFGNGDPAVDGLATTVGDMLLDALYSRPTPEGQPLLAGFYSLERHHGWGRDLPATPDGRLAGEPVSENQSPVYGADREGVTALLRSMVALPTRRTVMGGLNVKFGTPVRAETLESLIATYFAAGGIHLGFSFADRQTLEDAAAHPGRHRSLCVRMYGFSEYFVSLSPQEQTELIHRAEHSV